MRYPLSKYVVSLRDLLHDTNAKRRRPPLRRLKFESLEDRALFSVTPVSTPAVATTAATAVESIDGTGNNLQNTTWGSTNIDLLRIAAAAYADGISSPAGADRPSARAISNAVAAQAPDTDILNNRDLSAFVYAWGQFIDHDLDLTPTGTTAFNIAVPTGDPSFDPNGTGTAVISLNRSITDPATGTSTTNPAQQVNTITAYLDGSMIYGSDAARAAALRTFTGGLLKTSAGDLLPFNTAGLPNANDAHIFPDSQLFLAGDVRANENVELTALQTLFVREHNHQADSASRPRIRPGPTSKSSRPPAPSSSARFSRSPTTNSCRRCSATTR